MKKLLIVPVLLLSAIGYTLLYSSFVSKDLSDNLLRLHIIADSNSDKDQRIKLLVRDEILADINEASTLGSINSSADAALLSAGAPYRASTSLEYCFVPEKEYKSISLPGGMYNCLKVTLGDGDGENWWCVAYPPLCFTEEVFGELTEDGRALLEGRLSRESFRAIVNSGDVNFRFKILEEAQKLIRLLS